MKRLLATSLFATAAYTFTLLAGLPVANAAAAPGGVVTTPPSAMLSPATAALSDGDDIRARAIAAAQFDQLQQSALLPALTPATAALADGDDVRALGIVAVQFDQSEQPASLFVLSPRPLHFATVTISEHVSSLPSSTNRDPGQTYRKRDGGSSLLPPRSSPTGSRIRP